MIFPIKFVAAMAVYLPLIAAIISTKALELRPSEHGLEFQSPPAAGEISSPEMQSFFGGKSSPTPEIALPRATNSSEAPGWWTHREGGNRHLRIGLLVATAVCGLTGVSLLVGSVLFYIYKVHRHRSLGLSSNNNHK